MKHLKHLLIVSTVTALCACNNTKESPVSLQWEMVKNGAAPGFYESSFTITNTSTKPLESDWEIYYTQLSPRQVKVNEDSPVIIEMINAGYYKIAPSESWTPLAPGDSIKISYLNQGIFTQTLFTPKSPFFVTNNGTQISIPLSIAPFDRKEQWTVQGRIAPSYPDGEKVYADNQALETTYKIQTYDMLPSLKEVTPREGTSIISKDISLSVEDGFADEAKLLIQNLKEMGYNVTDKGQTVIALCHFPQNMQAKNDEHYRLDVKDNYITISGGTPHAIFNGTQTLVSLLKKQTIPAKFENIAINDYPDLLYRGMMLDIARNFTKKADLLKLINQLAAYKINVLHFHFSDDEAWRLEIPGLEELTEIASRRGHTTDELTCLYPAYAWGWNEADTTSLANGYYSRNDFMDILKYAKERHIRIIPEIDIPGHSRAAIKAMNARYRKYIDTDQSKAEEYLLIDFADTSQYLSAQNFTDNVINVAMLSTYRFLEKVIDEIGRMYQDAGVELPAFHVGGDEVPEGIWEGSSVCRTFMKKHGLTKIRDLKDYFLGQILEMLDKRNIQAVGWQDIVMNPDNTVNEHFRNSKVLNYCWNTIPEQGGDEVPYKLANAGYPIILCNVGNFYLDMAYCYHVEEPGLRWGGYEDEYVTFDMLPFDIYKSLRRNLKGESVDVKTASNGKQPLTKEGYKNIKGLSGQIWAETIRSFEQIEYYLFPKVFGLAERVWNAQPSWALSPDGKVYMDAKRKYNAGIVTYELPRLAKRGINFRVSPPGIIVKDGLLLVNTTNPNAVIRYTTDGSEPTESSVEWQTQIACDAPLIKAKAFYLGKESVTTVLINELY